MSITVVAIGTTGKSGGGSHWHHQTEMVEKGCGKDNVYGNGNQGTEFDINLPDKGKGKYDMMEKDPLVLVKIVQNTNLKGSQAAPASTTC